jgi:hypothetical protein
VFWENPEHLFFDLVMSVSDLASLSSKGTCHEYDHTVFRVMPGNLDLVRGIIGMQHGVKRVAGGEEVKLKGCVVDSVILRVPLSVATFYKATFFGATVPLWPQTRFDIVDRNQFGIDRGAQTTTPSDLARSTWDLHR